jgi:hypothetical protein
MKRFWNFLSAYVRAEWWRLRGRSVLAGPITQGQRFLFCQTCPYHQDGLCTTCGCLVAAKISLNSEKCPRNYWPRVKLKKNSGELS